MRNEPQRFGVRVMLGSFVTPTYELRTTLRFVEVRMKPDLVERNPEIMSGALCFTGTRVPVRPCSTTLKAALHWKTSLKTFRRFARKRPSPS